MRTGTAVAAPPPGGAGEEAGGPAMRFYAVKAGGGGLDGVEPQLLTARNARHPPPRERSNAAPGQNLRVAAHRRPCGARARYRAGRSKNVGGVALR